MSVLTEIHDTVANGISNIEGWAADLKAKLPDIADRAAKFESSPIVQALEGLVLPPAVEQDIANLIRHYAATTPAVDTAAQPVFAPAAPAAGA